MEVPNLQHNIPAVLAVMKFIYDHIMYAELNTKSDYCQVCDYDGEIKIVEEDGKLLWECPVCGNRDEKNTRSSVSAATSAPTSSTRAGRRRSRKGCCIYELLRIKKD